MRNALILSLICLAACGSIDPDPPVDEDGVEIIVPGPFDEYLVATPLCEDTAGLRLVLRWQLNAYLKAAYEGQHFRVFADSGNQPIVVSEPVEEDFGIGHSGIYYKHWNITCADTSHGACSFGTAMAHFADNFAFANVFVASVDVASLFPSTALYRNGSTDKIKVFYPTDPWGECDGGAEAHREYLCAGSAMSNHSLAHEAGHVVWMRALDIDASEAASGCNPHDWNYWLPEKCAIQEGWADFVAGATYFTPSASEPYFLGPGYELEGRTDFGNTSDEICTYKASSPQNREGNAARFFWDLYDTTWNGDGSGGYSDNTSMSIEGMVDVWDSFPDGTADRKSRESDQHGRNAYDYVDHHPAAESELYINCLTNQDTN